MRIVSLLLALLIGASSSTGAYCDRCDMYCPTEELIEITNPAIPFERLCVSCDESLDLQEYFA